MLLRDAIKNVDRSPKNTETADVEHFARIFDINMSWDQRFGERVKEHFIQKWICTDTWVGMKAYYFDGEPVAASYQSARKNDVRLEFLSKEAALKVRDFILTLQIEKEEPHIPVLDEVEEIGEFYHVRYNGALLDYKGFYKGEEVEVVRTDRTLWNTDRVMIRTTADCCFEIPLAKFDIPYNVKKE
jgi:hypothetical protein